MSKTVVITAHGRIDQNLDNAIVLPIDILTSCKFGEYHDPKLIKFHELNVFNQPYSLYKYVLEAGDSYLNKGSVYPINTRIPNIIFTPFKTVGDPVKIFSWQKSYVINHLIKTCKHEIADNIKYKDTINTFNINAISLDDIRDVAKGDKNLSLLSSIHSIEHYYNSYTMHDITINNRQCSLTYNSDRSVNIIDYESGGFLNDNDDWSLLEFIEDLDCYAKNCDNGLTGVESIIIKACLSTE